MYFLIYLQNILNSIKKCSQKNELKGSVKVYQDEVNKVHSHEKIIAAKTPTKFHPNKINC